MANFETRKVNIKESGRDNYGNATPREMTIKYNNRTYYLVQPEYLNPAASRYEAPLYSENRGNAYFTQIDGKRINLEVPGTEAYKRVSMYDKIGEKLAGAGRFFKA